MSHSPKISVIVPTLNVEKYIEQTIKSVLEQSYSDWEMVIMDGLSTDSTAKIVKKYADRDPRIRFYSEPDESNWDATEKAVALARGEFMDIIAGQDGFLDKDWFMKCLAVFESNKSVSMVCASTRGMRDDGTLWPEEYVAYSHLIKNEGKVDAARHVSWKLYWIFRDLLFGSIVRKKILLKKIFSKTAILKLNFLTRRSFPGGVVPQKEEWFKYWLDTGLPFSDQASCISKHVYLDCKEKYPRGSRHMNYVTDLFFNFNAKGYLAYYLPTLATFGRMHPGNSGDKIPEKLYIEQEKYFEKVLALRKRILNNHEEMVFVDREGKEVSRKKF